MHSRGQIQTGYHPALLLPRLVLLPLHLLTRYAPALRQTLILEVRVVPRPFLQQALRQYLLVPVLAWLVQLHQPVLIPRLALRIPEELVLRFQEIPLQQESGDLKEGLMGVLLGAGGRT